MASAPSCDDAFDGMMDYDTSGITGPPRALDWRHETLHSLHARFPWLSQEAKSEIAQIALLFKWTGTALEHVWPWCIFFLVEQAMFCIWFQHWPKHYPKIDPLGHQLLMLPLSFLLVVRTTSCYNRYWQGHTIVTNIVVACRELASKAMTMCAAPSDSAEDKEALTTWQRTIFQLTYVFFIVSRHNLRKRSAGVRGDPHEYATFLSDPEVTYLKHMASNRPLMVISWLRRSVRTGVNTGLIAPELKAPIVNSMEKEIAMMLQSWQQASALCSTPMPMPYAHLLKVLLIVWTSTVGLVLASKLNNPVSGPWSSMFVIVLLAGTLFGLDDVGHEIEDPFGDDYNDIPVELKQADLLSSLAYIGYGLPLYNKVERLQPTVSEEWLAWFHKTHGEDFDAQSHGVANQNSRIFSSSLSIGGGGEKQK